MRGCNENIAYRHINYCSYHTCSECGMYPTKVSRRYGDGEPARWWKYCDKCIKNTLKCVNCGSPVYSRLNRHCQNCLHNIYWRTGKFPAGQSKIFPERAFN